MLRKSSSVSAGSDATRRRSRSRFARRSETTARFGKIVLAIPCRSISNDFDQRRAPGVTDTKTNQRHAIAGFDATLFQSALEGYGNGGGNGIAALFHVDPELFGGDLHLRLPTFEHEFICLMQNHKIKVVKTEAGLIEQLLHGLRNGLQRESEHVSAVHKKILF